MRTMGRMGRMGLMLACAVMIAACADSQAEFRGRMVTHETLDRTIEQAIRTQQERDRLEAEGIAREARKRQTAFELAISRMDATHALDLASLRAEYEASAEATRDALAAIARRSEEAIASIRDDGAAAAADIQRQDEQKLGAFNFAAKVLPMTPAAPWTELILGGSAALLGIERIRKGVAAGKAEKAAIEDRDKNWEEGYARGKAEAEAKADAANKAWDEALLNAAAGRMPAVVAPTTT